MTTELKKIKSIKDHRGGGLILSMDYSTLEVRIFCAICGDPLLKEVLNSGKDLHCQTARAVFPELRGLSDKEIKEHHNGLRSRAKGVMFGLLYGKTTFNFAKEWGCTVDEAQAVLDGLMGAYPAIKTYVNEQHEFAKKNGYVVNMFGQRRPLPGAQLPEFGPTRKQFKHAMNAAQNTPIQCFTGDTKIDLLDGTTVTIDSLVNNFDNKYVLSCCEDGRIVPGKVINAMQTGVTNRLCKIKLDNEEIIQCTPEHQFMLRDGTYKHAIDLKPNDSLMPCYKVKNKRGYYLVKNNSPRGKLWSSIHRITCNYYDRNLTRDEVVHHVDFDKENNNPDNLIIMNKNEHIKYHANLIMETCERNAKKQGISVHEYMRQMGLKYTPENRSINAKKIVQDIRDGKRKNYMWSHFLTKEHSEKQSIAMANKNKIRSQRYKKWDQNQKMAVSRELKRRMSVYGNTMCFSPEQLSEFGRKNINKIWQGNDQQKISYMKENIKRCGSNTSFFKFKKHVLKMLENGYTTKESVLNSNFEEVWNNYRLNCGIRLASIPKYTKALHDRFIKEVFNNHKVVSVELITSEKEIPVYDIEIENKDNTHNFALSAGVFVHNSSASIMAWIAGAHVQEEFCLQNMQSVMIGGVHDSTYVDVYPKELIKCMKIFNFHAEVAANKIHNWMNGVHLPADFGLGQSWGRELDVKKWELHDGNMCQLTLKGGDVNWEYLKRELDEAYDYKVISIEDGDAITEEEHENIPVRQSNKYVTVTLDFIDPDPNIEYKSKYYVGNGTFGKRIDTRENPIKSLL